MSLIQDLIEDLKNLNKEEPNKNEVPIQKQHRSSQIKIFFDVPFKEKQFAKEELEMKWDNQLKKWFKIFKTNEMESIIPKEYNFKIHCIEGDISEDLKTEFINNFESKRLFNSYDRTNSNVQKDDILFITNAEVGQIINYTFDIKYGLRWQRFGETKSKLYFECLPENIKYIILRIDPFKVKEKKKIIDNLPIGVEKLYIEENIFIRDNFLTKDLIETLIKVPFGCEVIYFNSCSEIKELEKHKRYFEHILTY